MAELSEFEKRILKNREETSAFLNSLGIDEIKEEIKAAKRRPVKNSVKIDYVKLYGRKVLGKRTCNKASDFVEEPTFLKKSMVTLTKLESSKVAGTLLLCGSTAWDWTGRPNPERLRKVVWRNLWGPHRLSTFQGIRVSAVFSGCSANHSVIIAENGSTYTWGKNDKGQLGLGDSERRDSPTKVGSLDRHNIVAAACGQSHTLFLSDKGTVYSSGDNKMGQLGFKRDKNDHIHPFPTKVYFEGAMITKVACGAEFSVAIDAYGVLWSFGSPEYGQLGHNPEGIYHESRICTPTRITSFIEKTRERYVVPILDVQITDVACGVNHTIAMDTKKRCFTWGWGGYGRLGHGEQKDEFVPRLVKSFDEGVNAVYAGGDCCMAIDESEDEVLFWGRKNRVDTQTQMSPTPIPNVKGQDVTHIACGLTSRVIVTDKSVIAWGPSPSYGELGYGESEKKSSKKPLQVNTLNGIHIEGVTCGSGHTLYIASDRTKEDEEKLNQFPIFTPIQF